MLLLPSSVRIFLAIEPVDMRCGFDKLGRAVTDMGMDAYSGHLFVFVSRRGDRIKVLAWDRGGFVLWYKRLEKGRFKLPKHVDGNTSVALDGPSLTMLLDGIDYARVRRPVHWLPKDRQEDRHEVPSVI
jgi:transposase